MGYAIMKTLKYHTFNQLTGQQKHNNREIPMPHIDWSKTIQNQYLVNPGMTYTEAWKNRLQNAEIQYNKKIKVRKNAVLSIDLLLTYSPEADVPLKQWTAANVEWLKKKFGEDNILACTLHMDETTPHIHAEIIPIDDRGRLCARSFIDGPYSLKLLQDDYAEDMKPFGLERGMKATKAKNKSLKEFYKAVNEIDNNPAPMPFEDESELEYINRLKEYIRTMKLALYNLQLQADRTSDILDTKINTILHDYLDALSLYDQIADGFDDDSDLIHDRLSLYKQIEQCVPRVELDKVLKFLLEKYPPEENLLSNEEILKSIGVSFDK